MDAVERLNRFKEESKIRERKHELYTGKRWVASDNQRSVGVEKILHRFENFSTVAAAHLSQPSKVVLMTVTSVEAKTLRSAEVSKTSVLF